jgi:hypothetical protein
LSPIVFFTNNATVNSTLALQVSRFLYGTTLSPSLTVCVASHNVCLYAPIEQTQRLSIYGKEQRVGVGVILSSDCIGCLHGVVFRRLPFLRGQILVSVMHCSPTIHPDIPLRRIGILFHLASLLTFGHISALIGPYA